MAPSNTAAWLESAKAHPFVVKPVALGSPVEDQVLIKNHALAINPIDYKLQAMAMMPLKYPTILGSDVAGEIIALGPNVSKYKVGDRVLGLTIGFDTANTEDKGFQAYSILQSNVLTPLPRNLSFEEAVVVPTCLATAGAALFEKEFLGLQLPTEPAQNPTGKTVVVWGGASSVGSNAIQLAVAAGYEAVTTASEKNFEALKKLGASAVYDYHNESSIAELVEACKTKQLVGIVDSIGRPAWQAVLSFVEKLNQPIFVATVNPGFPEPAAGITLKSVHGTTVAKNFVGKAIFEDFLPSALASGTFTPAPKPLVVGKGLESVQAAVDRVGRGMSAAKAVVTL